MITLKQLQQNFQKAYSHPDNVECFAKHIKIGKNLSNFERFAVYSESIIEGKAIALRLCYPACEQLVSERFFTNMAYSYIEQYPSSSPSLFDYGKFFYEFIKSFQPADNLPYLSDVARLEWAYHLAYYASDNSQLDISTLSKLDENADIFLKLQPESTLLRVNYPIKAIWELATCNIDTTIQLEECDEKLLVWRHGNEVKVESLSNNEWLFLNGISKNVSLNDLCDLSSEQLNNEDITRFFSHAINQGWFASFDVFITNT